MLISLGWGDDLFVAIPAIFPVFKIRILDAG